MKGIPNEATNLECFHIRNGEAFIGFKSGNGNFDYIQIPYTAKGLPTKLLTQDIFKDQPENVNWAGVDYDGKLSFGEAYNPRYTWASERWRGFNLVGEPIRNTNYKPLTSINKER